MIAPQLIVCGQNRKRSRVTRVTSPLPHAVGVVGVVGRFEMQDGVPELPGGIERTRRKQERG